MTSPSPLAPCPSPFNLAAHVLARAGDQPDKPALCILGRTDECWSFGEIAAAVRGTATGLARLGLGPGARILMRIGNRPDFPILYLGAIAAGMVPVPTSSQLTAPEITLMARLLSPDLIVAEDGLALPDPAPCDVLTLAQLRAFHRLPPAPYDLGPPDRAAYIVFTSGTSREPRAVVHGHRAIWARRSMLAGWTGLTGADRILHAGAFNWTYTLGVGLMDPWSVGATALIPAPGTRPADLPALLARSEATLFAAAPGVFRQMLRAPMPRLPRLRHGLSAGESLPEDLRGNWQAATGTPVHQAFGMSECSTFISGSSARPAPAGTLGFAQPGREVAILGADGAPLPAGEAGVIAIRGDDPGLMLGYLGAGPPPLTRGWFLTGDLGARGAGWRHPLPWPRRRRDDGGRLPGLAAGGRGGAGAPPADLRSRRLRSDAGQRRAGDRGLLCRARCDRPRVLRRSRTGRICRRIPGPLQVPAHLRPACRPAARAK